MNFYLPDFFFKFDLNFHIIQLLKSNPEYFYDDIKIASIYGCFPGAIWNGGRLMCGSTVQQNIQRTIEELNAVGVPIRYTFTNSLIEEKHLQDSYCNLLMDAANNGMNEVLVNSPILEDYLRKNYPNFKYILSTTRCERDINKINELTKNYDLIVLDFRDNANIDFLQQIEDKSKIELLVNSYCNPACQKRKHHYDLISRNQLSYRVAQTDDDDIMMCPTYTRNFYDIFEFPSVLTTDTIKEYQNMGFYNFKIEGRTLHIVTVIESYVYYLIKPEYRDQVRLQLLKQCIQWRE